MKAILREWSATGLRGWNAFWFRPSDPATLGLIRILGGAMLFYTHLVWSIQWDAFFGEHPWLSAEAVALRQADSYEWSYLWHIGSPGLLWAAHLGALVIFAMLALGLYTRVASILAFFIAVAYANRLPGAQFGLDQINVLLAMYLMIGPSGAAYSLDRLVARWRGRAGEPAAPRVGATIAVRLIQLHMCIIYLFAGLAKHEGLTWQNGTAIWGAAANLEYQSLDITWLADHLYLVNILTHVTVFWELFYVALVWPRFTRPIVIAMAVPLHLGIAFCMGMMTFGLVMIFANLAFVAPWLTRMFVDPVLTKMGSLLGLGHLLAAPSAPTKKPESQRRHRKPRGDRPQMTMPKPA